MRKGFFLFVAITLMLLLSSTPARASALPGDVYLDISLTTNGIGTQAQPYNNLLDAVNKARSLPGGAYLWEKQPNGSWLKTTYISGAVSGGMGEPLPNASLYVLLGLGALLLAFIGLQFHRRSLQLQQ